MKKCGEFSIHCCNFMALAFEYFHSFPQSLPTSLIRKILNMRPRHPVAEVFASETFTPLKIDFTLFF